MKYSGIDLHSNNCVVSVIDEEDSVVGEKRLPNDLPLIVGFLKQWPDVAGVVVESTYNWYLLVDGLQAARFTVHLANTAAIKKYEGLKHSGDAADARYLAHLLRLKILPSETILAKEARALRDLGRKRIQLVRNRTMHILSVENITARQFGRRLGSNAVKALDAGAIEAMPVPRDVALAVKASVAVIDALTQQIELVERRLQKSARPRPEYRHLMSVPGIGPILATIILLETGPIERFAKVGNYASYARRVDSVRTSNGKKKGEGNAKNGNAYLAWAFVEAANFARRYCDPASASTSARRRGPTRSLRPRRWRTNLRAPASTS